MKGCLRPLGDIGLAFLSCLKFFLALFLLIRYLILVFSNIFYFFNKMFNIDSAHMTALKKVFKIKFKGGLQLSI